MFSIKIARPDWSQTIMNHAKKIDLARIYIQINKTIFFSTMQHFSVSFLADHPPPPTGINTALETNDCGIIVILFDR